MAHEIQTWPIARFVPYARNPRKNDAVVDRMVGSIKEFGFKIPILARSDGLIVDGHLRLKAAERLGITELPVILCDEWTEGQVKAFRLIANRSVAWAEWDEELLKFEFEDLKNLDFDLDLTGFDETELDRFIGAEIHGNAGLVDPDMMPEPLDAAISQTGDLWNLGDHRLLCGNSMLDADLDRLLAGEKIQLVSTDPPYNVRVEPRTANALAAGSAYDFLKNIADGKKGGLMHHQRFDIERLGMPPQKARKMRPRDRTLVSDFKTDDEFMAMLRAWFSNLARALEPGRNFYVWGGYGNCKNYPQALDEAGLYFSQAIIWVKNKPTLVRKTFLNAHEWCFYGWREGGAHYFHPLIRNAWDVWQIDKVSGQGAVHLTEKPVEITVRTLTYSSKAGENVLDIFGGSGSTMIGAEMTGRHAFLMEIDPYYCDIIVRRWQNFTGKSAVLEGTGKTFDEVQAERGILVEKGV